MNTTNESDVFRYVDPDTGQAIEHKIEETVNVCLIVRDGRWVIDPVTVDGWSLDPAHDGGASNSECPCGDEDSCDAAKAAADKLPFPNGEDLAAMLADALGSEFP